MRKREKFIMIRSANEERTRQTSRSRSRISVEQAEGQQAVSHLDRYYMYVDYLTYLDISSSESSVPLIHPVFSSAESHSLGITTNGNEQIIQKPITSMGNGNLGKKTTLSAAYMKASAEVWAKNSFGIYDRRDLQ